MNTASQKIKARAPAKLKKFKRREVLRMGFGPKEISEVRKHIEELCAVLPDMSEEERKVHLHARLEELRKDFFFEKVLYPVYMRAK